jgi:hypothetical protein
LPFFCGYHSTVGAFLSGVDRRAKAYVLMAGGLSDEVDLKSAEYRAYRDKVGAEKFDAFVTEYSWLDQGKYVSQQHRHLCSCNSQHRRDF